MLLEDIMPLHHQFTVDGYQFKAENFGDKYIYFAARDPGGLEVGGIDVSFDDDGNDVQLADAEGGNILSRLAKTGNGDKLVREIKKSVKSTL